MKDSYYDISRNTDEFVQGRAAYHEGKNPYEGATKQWLDWQLGYESMGRELVAIASLNYLRVLMADSLGLPIPDPIY